MIEKISHFIAYHPKIILTVATLLLIPCFFGYINMQINYDIMSYLPEDLDSVKGEVILDEVFGNSANAFLVIEDINNSYHSIHRIKVMFTICHFSNAIYPNCSIIHIFWGLCVKIMHP